MILIFFKTKKLLDTFLNSMAVDDQTLNALFNDLKTD